MSDPLILPVLDAVERILPALIDAARQSITDDTGQMLDRLTATRAEKLDTTKTAVDTLVERLTATRAEKLDTTKTAVDTLLARLTATRAEKLDSLGNSSVVKSIQRGVTEVTALSLSVTVAAVNTAKALVIASPIDGVLSTNPATAAGAGVALTSATALTFTRVDSIYSTSKNPRVAWQLVEFY